VQAVTIGKEAAERGRMTLLAAIAALRGAFHNMRGVIWQPFVLSLGVDMKSLGGLESLMDLSRLVVQPIVGSASDIHGRRRWLIARDAITLLIGLLMIATRSWHLLYLIVILIGLERALYPIWTAMVAESVEAERLGYVFSILATATTGAGIVSTLAAGYIAGTYGYNSVFTIATGFVVLSLFLVKTRLPETKAPDTTSGMDLRKIVDTLIGTLRPSPKLRGFYIAMTVDLFAFGMGWRLLYGMLTSGYGYTPQMLGLISTVTTGAMAVSQIFIGRHVDRIGYRKYLAISQSLACIALSIVVISKRFEVVLISQALMGITASFWGPAEQAWIASNVDPEERAQAIGSYAAFRGLLSFPAPFIGGLLYDSYGFNTPVIINIAIALIDTILILVLIKDKP
jgi:MFS family permease